MISHVGCMRGTDQIVVLPADLGDFIDYQNVVSLYIQQANGHEAIRQIIEMNNFEAFLAKSGCSMEIWRLRD